MVSDRNGLVVVALQSFLPRFMQSCVNEFLCWIKPFLERKFITGFVPIWTKQAFRLAVVASIVSIVVKNLA